jgi:PAS domain S-box-containing protein
MNELVAGNWWRGGAASERVRALAVSVAACGAAFALAGGPRAAAVSVLPAIFILAEFTGGWFAMAISTALLITVSLIISAPIYPLMLTVVCALLSARAIRRGVPVIVPVVLLAGAGISADILFGEGARAGSPSFVAMEFLDACFNVALVTIFVIARPPGGIWKPPVRRWRFEDVLFLGSVAASIPAAVLLRGAAPDAQAASGWWVVGVMFAVQAAVATVSVALHRVPLGLRVVLKKGRMRSARRRSARLPREIGHLFLSARHISDGLHRRTALQGLHIESARLRAGRLQQQVESLERERRRMDLALSQANVETDDIDRGWRAFLDSVPEALFIADHTGRVEYVNDGVRRLLGFEPAKLMGSQVAALIPAAKAGKEPIDFAAIFATSEGDAPFAERSVRLSDTGGSLRDVSMRIQVFQTPQGKRLCIRLREGSGPMQRTRDQFVATMSHEIRTPLHGLMATLDMLRSEALSPVGGRRLGIARTSAKTLMRIANDVLDLSRISAGGMPIERKPMSIERLITDIVDEAKSSDDALRLDIRVVFGQSLPPAVLGDPLRMKQVLRNLVSNALKFTASGSVIVGAYWSGGHCMIDVADTGAGIPVDRRESIFEAFVQADGGRSRRHGGAGLGLAIARQLSEAMGGSLSLLQSGPRGSTFRMLLPLPATDEMPLDEQSQRNLAAVKGRILVAEDDEASRYVAQTLLESLECPARIVSNGIEALEMMRSEEFDLALLDCEMPGLDGYEVTARVRQMGGRHIPIIAMTASTMSSDRQRCFEAGMDDLLAKPFGKAALNEMLTKWLSPQPGSGSRAPWAQELAMRPELDSEVFDELRQSLNWQLPKLRRIYQSIRESAHKAIAALGGGVPPDLELAQRSLHSLQGGAGLVGARQIEHLAARMGQSLREGSRQDLAEGLPLLLDVLRRFDRALDQRLDALSAR